MAGVYFHFPFCKQACTYCNFHFRISKNDKDEMVKSMCEEIKMNNKNANRMVKINTKYKSISIWEL